MTSTESRTSSTRHNANHAEIIHRAVDRLRDLIPAVVPSVDTREARHALRVIEEHTCHLSAAPAALAAARDGWEETATSHMRRIRELAQERDTMAAACAETSDLAAIREVMLSDVALQAATNAVGYLDRTGGPDPNGYVRYTPSDYARDAITAALDTLMTGEEVRS